MSSYGRALTALADPTRRRILELIALAPTSVSQIAANMPISQPAVSQHLAQLKAAQLVNAEVQGRRHVYRIDRAGLVAIRSYIENMWGEALESYRKAAEGTHSGG
jgi:DNA-binding transcriptional ArsR family regulator